MPNSFMWYELMTTDLDAAITFYSAVVGWTTSEANQPDMRYVICEAGGRGMGGMMTLPQEACDAGAKPGWVGYIKVDDVDAAAARAQAAGATILRPTEDIPNVGPFSVLADPQGAVFMLIAPNGDGPPSPAAMTPGHVGWHELYAVDGATALDFYIGQYGWGKSDALDMGEMGTYQLFTDGGENAVGGVMTKPPFIPAPFWLFYVNVDGGAEAAAARITANGGAIVHGPAQVPGGSWIVQGTDPQGVMFALVAAEK